MNTNGVQMEEAIATESTDLHPATKLHLITELIFVEALYFVKGLHHVKKLNSVIELNLVAELYFIELEIKTRKNIETYCSIKINRVKGLNLLEL